MHELSASKPATLYIEVKIPPVLEFGSDKAGPEFLLPAENHSLAL